MPTLSSALVKQKVASMADVEEALARQVLYGGDLTTNLLEAASVSEAQLAEVLAASLDLEPAPGGELPRAPEATLRLLPAELAVRHSVYPLEERSGDLVLAVSEKLPDDVETDLGFSLGVRIVQRASPLVRVRQAIARDYGVPLEQRLERLISKLEGRVEPGRLSVRERPALGTQGLPKPPSLPPTGFPSEPPIDLVRPPRAPALDPSLMRTMGAERAPEDADAVAQPRAIDPGHAARAAEPEPPAAALAEMGAVSLDSAGEALSPITPAPDATREPTSLGGAAPPEADDEELPERPAVAEGAHGDKPTLQAAPLVSVNPPTKLEAKLESALARDRTYTLPSARLSSLVRTPLREGTTERDDAPAITGERPRSPLRSSTAPAASRPPVSDPAGLASWARSSLPPPPNRPRRGPYTPALAEADLRAAENRDDVMSAFFHFFAQYFEYAALFVVHPEFMEGRDGHGPGAGRAELARVTISLDADSSLKAARERGTYTLVKLEPAGGDAKLLHDLRRPAGRVSLLLPVMVRGRCVLMLYGDHGTEDVELSTIGEVLAFAPHVSAAFERVILNKKLGARRAVAIDSTLESMPRPLVNRRSDLPSRDRRVGALANALGPRGALSSRPPPPAVKSAPPEPTAASSPPGPSAATSSPLAPPQPARSAVPVAPPHFASRAPAAPVKAPPPARSLAARPSSSSALPARSAESVKHPVRSPGASPFSAPPSPGAFGSTPQSVPSGHFPPPSSRPPSAGPAPARFPLPSARSAPAPAAAPPVPAAESEKTPVATAAIRASWTVPVVSPPMDAEEAFPLTRKTSQPPPLRTAPSLVDALPAASGPEIAISEAISDDELNDVLDDVIAAEYAEDDEGDEDVDGERLLPASEDDLDEDWEDGVVSEDGKAPLAPSTRSVRFGARRLRPRHSAHDIKLPTVIVDVESDLRMLVDRIVDGDEGATEQLKEMGDEGVSALVSRFPGPITNEPRPGSPTLRPSRCGPVLHALVRIGRPAVPYLAVRTADGDAGVRAWATRLLGEIPSVESAEAIARRFMDPDEDVRRAALAGARLLENNLPAQASLRAALTRAALDSGQPQSARHAAIEALADLRSPEAVPDLIRLLDDPSPEIVESAHWALVVTTRQDFGTSGAAWSGWWERASGRHRIQWLIDSLTHENPEIRRAAGEELKGTTKEYFGYYDDLPKKERLRAQERYREWWETRGRILFS